MRKAYCAALASALLVLTGAGSLVALAETDETKEAAPVEAAPVEAAPVEAAPLTPAQTIIFDTPHLKDITGPTLLNYNFERKSVFEDGFTDEVKVNVDRVLEDGSKDVSFNFFSGDRNKPYPPVERFKGNPLIMVFLQHDAWGMSRLLGGDPNYFRNQVRHAFVDAAEVADVEVETSNGPVGAKKVTLRPFLHDKNAYHFGPNIRKVYEFTLSPEIPGEVYMIRTFVPPADAAGGKTRAESGKPDQEGIDAAAEEARKTGDGTEATIEETLVFESATPIKAAAAHSPTKERSEE